MRWFLLTAFRSCQCGWFALDMRPNSSFDADTQRHCAARRAGERTPCGAMPLRAIEAAKLYRQGYAPEIWLTHSTEPGATLEEMGILFAGEDHYSALVLIHEGVPAEAIHVLEPPIVNTADEVKVAASALVRAKGEAVILVTTKVHTRRVRLLWRRLASGQGQAIVRAASGDPFDPGHWWRNTRDLDVVREVLGVLNAWAGLPLHPAQ